MTREQLCSQQVHCLSCPISVLRTGRDCHEIKEDIMYIEGRWYTEPELVAYIKELKARNAELEAKHWDECRQIAHYDNELKELREENKVLISECDRLIKEKGELLKKLGQGGDVE